jgi:OmpA-OmpF porin, OOP family
MRGNFGRGLKAASVFAMAWPVCAFAQAGSEELMAMDVGSLRGEIQSRYDTSLALTLDRSVVALDNSRFGWASQAKAQCGIALGFLKSRTKDPVSIGKCVDAANRMQLQPPAPVVPLPPAPLPPATGACNEPIAGIVFFDWNSAAPPASSTETLDAVVQNVRACGWKAITVTGHTDRSGSDSYNGALSVRRAEAVGALLAAKGVERSVLNVSGRGESEPKVPTVDGERNPSNRRVEISVNR